MLFLLLACSSFIVYKFKCSSSLMLVNPNWLSMFLQSTCCYTLLFWFLKHNYNWFEPIIILLKQSDICIFECVLLNCMFTENVKLFLRWWTLSSVLVYFYSTFHNKNCSKAALQKMHVLHITSSWNNTDDWLKHLFARVLHCTYRLLLHVC